MKATNRCERREPMFPKRAHNNRKRTRGRKIQVVCKYDDEQILVQSDYRKGHRMCLVTKTIHHKNL